MFSYKESVNKGKHCFYFDKTFYNLMCLSSETFKLNAPHTKSYCMSDESSVSLQEENRFHPEYLLNFLNFFEREDLYLSGI